MKFDESKYLLIDDDGIAKKALIAGIIGLILSVVFSFIDLRHMLFSYLASLIFWLTIFLGGLFFVMLHHLTNSTWSIVLRRLAENMATRLTILAIMFLPILLGMGRIYPWIYDPGTVSSEVVQHKSAYLDLPFFIIRAILYFAIWIIISRILFRTSLKQDSGGNAKITKKFRAISAPGIVLFAITVTFASFDWIMSLDPHWYSTIFGVYVFSGSLLSGLAFMTFMVIFFQGRNVLRNAITADHFLDLGRLLFAFTVFWAYIAFSQFFLIWYANIPEETIWFAHRWEGSWKYFSLLIIFGHFVLPFLMLISRPAKRSRSILGFISVWLLFVHWVDIYWLVMPNFAKHGAHISLFDFSSWLGIGGIVVWAFLRSLKSSPLVPIGDERLESSLRIATE